MRSTRITLAIELMIALQLATSQTSTKPRESGIHLTIFRSPSTGIALRSGHAAINLGFYPTVLQKDGQRGTAKFVRVGGTVYAKDHGSSPYISPPIVLSLDASWKHGALTELGYRGTIYRRLSGRLGAAVLTTTDGQVRVNPTVGIDVSLGRSR